MPLSTLWFTDRSRAFLGTQGCNQERWINYHSGPTGYGIRPASQAIPLATGIRVHLIQARVMGLVQPLSEPQTLQEAEEAVQGLVPEIGAVLTSELGRYLRYCLKKGGWEGDAGIGMPDTLGEEARRIILEQMSLIAGLVWAFTRMRLPSLHLAYAVLEVEQEGEEVLGCTCGLGGEHGGREAVGSFEEHGGRGCESVGLATRPDIILERRSSGELLNMDWKTLAVDSSSWRAQWADSIQMAIGTAAAERRLGRRIAQYQVFGLVKGQRKKGWTGPNQYNGPKSQQSDFCYVEVRQANPPLGKLSFHTTGKWNEKTPTWEAPFPLDLRGLEPQAQITARLFWWVEQMKAEELQELFPVVGPLNHQPGLAERFSRGLLVEEREWQRRVWALYQLAEERGESPYALVGEIIPASWQCHRFSRDCSFIPICYRWAGWEDPLSMERDDGTPRYELRAPHHAAEAQQAAERGIELPVDEEEGEEE